MTINLIPASRFSIQQLTDVYNQTRADYLIPMPMEAAHLQAYLEVYDVDLERSVVAMKDAGMLGLGMLGVRQNRSWITRLGVLPEGRGCGIGARILKYMLEKSDQMGLETAILEVIAGNTPAHQLFSKCGFREKRVLLVLKREAGAVQAPPVGTPAWYEGERALTRFIEQIPAGQAWTNEPESLRNAGDVMALRVESEDGDAGWMVFRHQRSLLSHFIFHTEQGRPARMARILLGHLYRTFPNLDTSAENIALNDPHLPALMQTGFFEAFRRVEMHRTRSRGC